jgi:transposase-like protein
MKLTQAKVSFTEAGYDEWPVCPWCKQEIREIKFKRRGWFNLLTAFWCPNCRSLLSTSATFQG